MTEQQEDPEKAEVFRRVRQELTVKNRTFRLIKYKQCFLGKDLVTWILKNSDLTGANSREEAVMIGREWQEQDKLFHHVCFDHLFKDERLFYSFRPLRLVSRRGSLNEGVRVLQEIDEASDISLAVSDMDSFLKTLEISHVARYLLSAEKGVKVKDRSYHLKKYPKCFIGTEAVDWMESALLLNRAQAVEVGQALVDNQFIRHSANDRPFEDGHFFYTNGGCQSIPARCNLCMGSCLISLTDDLPKELLLRRCTPFRDANVPNLVMACVRRIVRAAEDGTHGLFRAAAPEAFMERIFTLLDCSSDGGLYVIGHLNGSDVGHVCAAVLKRFLHQLPMPLMTYELFGRWTALGAALRPSSRADLLMVQSSISDLTVYMPEPVTSSDTEKDAKSNLLQRYPSLTGLVADTTEGSSSSDDVGHSDEERIVQSAAATLLAVMPAAYRVTLLATLKAAHAVQANAACGMSASDLAYIFAPIFLWSPRSDPESVKRALDVRYALAFMIQHYPDL